MAKSRKSEIPAGSGKKKAASRKAAAGGNSPPVVDTAMAAQSAARMLVAGANKPQAQFPETGPKQESALFKQLKAGLSKPHSAAMSNLLDRSHGPEPVKSHAQFKQLGRNQTFGPDVTRSGVPRRTPG